MDFRQRLEESEMHMVVETDEPVACPYFAMERGRNSICLELRLADGSRKAIPYSFVTEIAFDAGAGIEILTTQKRITITGRALVRLYEALLSFRVRYVQADVGFDEQEEGLYVADILIAGL